MRRRQLAHFPADIVGLRVVGGRREVNELPDLLHVRFRKAARRDGGRSEPDAARKRGVLRVIRDLVLLAVI